ncbi:MAG: winged helix-turn-helix transcriptional regulator [Thaumarchaeota archaeon]|nr:winged helix-turn-helix transcriptional regulator [Nitrososphaerota archaeon]
MGTVQYHLNLLEKNGRITSERHNLHRFYFPVGIFKESERNVLKILSQETAREILMLIIERKEPSQTDIVNSVRISAASVNWHIKRLIELGIINETKEGKFKKYKMIADATYVIKLLKIYHPNIWNNWSNRLAEMFLSLSTEGKPL